MLGTIDTEESDSIVVRPEGPQIRFEGRRIRDSTPDGRTIHTLTDSDIISYTLVGHSEQRSRQDTLEIEMYYQNTISSPPVIRFHDRLWTPILEEYRSEPNRFTIITIGCVPYQAPEIQEIRSRVSNGFPHTTTHDLYQNCNMCLWYSEHFPDFFSHDNILSGKEPAFLEQMKDFLDHCDEKHMKGKGIK